MENREWGRDIVKARLTQKLRGDDVASKQKLFALISNIITAILAGVAGYIGGVQ